MPIDIQLVSDCAWDLDTGNPMSKAGYFLYINNFKFTENLKVTTKNF